MIYKQLKSTKKWAMTSLPDLNTKIKYWSTLSVPTRNSSGIKWNYNAINKCVWKFIYVGIFFFKMISFEANNNSGSLNCTFFSNTYMIMITGIYYNPNYTYISLMPENLIIYSYIHIIFSAYSAPGTKNSWRRNSYNPIR